jgi:hypothetical protein
MATPSYFGRAWKLEVDVAATGETWTLGSSVWGKESMRVAFDIDSAAFAKWWFGDISIYNPAPGLQQFIKAGDVVRLSAGYESPGTNNRMIFQGNVTQPLWERVNATDYRLLLHCNVGKFVDDQSHVETMIAAGTTAAAAVRQVANDARIKVAYIDPSLSDPATTKPRGEPYFGSARLFFDRIAKDHGMNCWIGWDGLYLRSLVPQGSVPNLVFAPPLSPTSSTATLDGQTRYTLVGAPQQTQEGVLFRTLLDSELSLGALVKLDFSTLRKLPLAPMQLPRIPNPDGVYIVFGLHHTGDSRGNDWYTEVRAITRPYTLIYEKTS